SVVDTATVLSCPGSGDWSWPSNHAVLAAAFATACILVVPRLAWFALPLALAIAASRVAAGVHYVHDVLSGLALGALVVAAVVAAHPPRPPRSSSPPLPPPRLPAPRGRVASLAGARLLSRGRRSPLRAGRAVGARSRCRRRRGRRRRGGAGAGPPSDWRTGRP